MCVCLSVNAITLKLFEISSWNIYGSKTWPKARTSLNMAAFQCTIMHGWRFNVYGIDSSCTCQGLQTQHKNQEALGCHREAVRCFVSMTISLSHSRSFQITFEYGMHKSLLIFHRNFVSSLYLFWDIQHHIIATLKSGLGIIQGHWKRQQSIDRIRVLFVI